MVDVNSERIAALAKESPRVLRSGGRPLLREAREALEILGVALPPPEAEVEAALPASEE